MTTGTCGECGKTYEYKSNPNFPRKYCFDCAALKKAEYEGKPIPEKEEKVAQNGHKQDFKECHLSPEQVRSNALNCAIEAKNTFSLDSDLMSLAKLFEEYIFG